MLIATHTREWVNYSVCVTTVDQVTINGDDGVFLDDWQILGAERVN